MENTKKAVVTTIVVSILSLSFFLLGIYLGPNATLSTVVVLSALLVIIAHCVSRIVDSVLVIANFVKAKSFLSNIIERIQSMNPEFRDCLEIDETRKANYAVYWKMLNQI